MTPPGLHAPGSRCVGASQSLTGEPPASSARFSVVPDWKANERLSGDQNGGPLPSLPGTRRTSPVRTDRSHSVAGLEADSTAPNSSQTPSGEIDAMSGGLNS